MSRMSNHVLPDNDVSDLLAPGYLLDSDLELEEPDPDLLTPGPEEARRTLPPAPKEYVVTAEPTRTPGTGRYKVTHNTPDGAKVYRVSWGSKAMHCTCPDATCRPGRQGRCKHCQFVARLIGRPHLAGLPDPNF